MWNQSHSRNSHAPSCSSLQASSSMGQRAGEVVRSATRIMYRRRAYYPSVECTAIDKSCVRFAHLLDSEEHSPTIVVPSVTSISPS